MIDQTQWRRHRASGIISPALAKLLLVLGGLVLPGAVGGQVVIVNDSIVEEQISRSAVRAVFTVRLQRLSDQRLQVFVLDNDHPTHAQFTRQVLGVFPYQLREAWKRATFSGTGSSPTVLSSEDEMLRRVASTAGAIGYLTSPVAHPDVRVLAIEGVDQ